MRSTAYLIRCSYIITFGKGLLLRFYVSFISIIANALYQSFSLNNNVPYSFKNSYIFNINLSWLRIYRQTIAINDYEMTLFTFLISLAHERISLFWLYLINI